MKRIFLFILATLVALSAIAAEPVAPINRTLPVYNKDGFSTEVHVVNATDAPAFVDFYPNLTIGPKQSSVAAKSIATNPVIEAGTGGVEVAIDPTLDAYSVITSPVGGRLYVGELPCGESLTFYDLAAKGDPNYNSGVFILAKTDSVVQVVGGDSTYLKAGQAALLPASGDVAIVRNDYDVMVGYPGLKHGTICGFGYVNNGKTNSMQAVLPR